MSLRSSHEAASTNCSGDMWVGVPKTVPTAVFAGSPPASGAVAPPAEPSPAPPGGESLHQVSARVGAALETVLARHGGRRILLVAHVGTIRALTARALDTPASSMNRMELAPASITTLTWYADGNASMRSFAESAHVDGLGTTWTP